MAPSVPHLLLPSCLATLSLLARAPLLLLPNHTCATHHHAPCLRCHPTSTRRSAWVSRGQALAPASCLRASLQHSTRHARTAAFISSKHHGRPLLPPASAYRARWSSWRPVSGSPTNCAVYNIPINAARARSGKKHFIPYKTPSRDVTAPPAYAPRTTAALTAPRCCHTRTKRLPLPASRLPPPAYVTLPWRPKQHVTSGGRFAGVRTS